ncbi:RidA family protein [Glycomyces albidus]|jgi:reactive intermediate/imine deaminase|uniref:RidA family protein n=1 Tax=Glycomyces albidus TaxID=2656774 RepID=A0A6L5GB36_9ACTN|nr:RidA family protein [Glycomyces albidus]MQM26922.1 RidA family protein [Glycomyces albidus]
MTEKLAIRTDAAPAPAHAFPQGVRKGPLLTVSGQGPVDPATGEYLYPGDVKAQTRRTLENVAAIVEAGGAAFADVMMLRVYLADRGDFAAMNEVYEAFLAERIGGAAPYPCRTTVVCTLPRAEMLVEIDALACVD